VPVNTEVMIDEQISWRINYSDFVDHDRDAGTFIMMASGLKFKEIPVIETDSTMNIEKQHDSITKKTN
jgi:hypothetical protein